MNFYDVINFCCNSCSDNTIKRVVTPAHISLLKEVLALGENDLGVILERLEDHMKSRVANQLVRILEFCDRPSYEKAHLLVGNKADAIRLMELAFLKDKKHLPKAWTSQTPSITSMRGERNDHC